MNTKKVYIYVIVYVKMIAKKEKKDQTPNMKVFSICHVSIVIVKDT